MKKINIVKKNEDFDYIIKNGKILKNKYFTIYYIPETKDKYRIGITVPKKIGKAVLRNKIKRQIKEIIDDNKKIIKELDFIIIARSFILDLKYLDMEIELVKILKDL